MSSGNTLLLSKYQRGKRTKPRKSFPTSLGVIAGMPGESNDRGILHLDEHRQSRVIRFNPDSLPLGASERENSAIQIEELIRKTGLNLQLVVISQKMFVEEALQKYELLRNKSNEYLKWLVTLLYSAHEEVP